MKIYQLGVHMRRIFDEVDFILADSVALETEESDLG